MIYDATIIVMSLVESGGRKGPYRVRGLASIFAYVFLALCCKIAGRDKNADGQGKGGLL